MLPLCPSAMLLARESPMPKPPVHCFLTGPVCKICRKASLYLRCLYLCRYFWCLCSRLFCLFSFQSVSGSAYLIALSTRTETSCLTAYSSPVYLMPGATEIFSLCPCAPAKSANDCTVSVIASLISNVSFLSMPAPSSLSLN